jgi:Flp pilus assembly protein TadG
MTHLKKLLGNQQGEAGMLSFMYIFLMLLIFAYLGIDIYGYMVTKQNLTLAVNETLEIVKAENGYDHTTKQSFDDFIIKLGLDPSKVTVTATNKTVQRGTPVEVVASTKYEAKGLKPFGNTLNLDIEVKANGLAHAFIR